MECRCNDSETSTETLHWNCLYRWKSHPSSALTKLSQEVWGIAETVRSWASQLQTERKSCGIGLCCIDCHRSFILDLHFCRSKYSNAIEHISCDCRCSSSSSSTAARLSSHCLKIRWIEVIYFLLSIECRLQGAQAPSSGDHSIYNCWTVSSIF